MKPSRTAILALVLVSVLLTARTPAAQQQTPPPAAAPQPSEPRQPTAAEVQALFDAMVIVQAQKALNLTDSQYPQFVGRLKALQDTRQRNQRARQQLIQQMQRQTNPQNASPVDDAQLRALLKSFEEQQAQTAADVRKAYEGVDQILDLRQQVRFRVFEEQIERRKFEFLLNARRRAQTTQSRPDRRP